jgi:hypothetical protein
MNGSAPHSAGLPLVKVVAYHSGMQRLQYDELKAIKNQGEAETE